MRILSLAMLLALAILSSGCAHFSNVNGPDQWDRGLLLVLPGVEGASWWNSNVAQGLRDGGFDGAIEVDDWTTGNPLLFPVHLRSSQRHREQSQRIARQIVEYQQAYPGRPVHVVGISGGGGVSLLTLEALPPGRRVTSLTLLSPAVAPGYDLMPALDHADRITNFHSPFDVFVLGIGTTALGTTDGRHGPAAGMVGFSDLDELPHGYRSRVEQVPYELKMASSGNLGGHMGASMHAFVRDWVAPRIVREAGHPLDARLLSGHVLNATAE